MFEIQSYIKVNDEFIAIEDIKGNSVYKKMDKRSIEGAITIKYYTQIILDLTYWDYIEELWLSIIAIFEDSNIHEYAKMLSPDQPVSLEIVKDRNEMSILRISHKNQKQSFYLPEKEFIKSLALAFNDFSSFLND